ncbi:MAG: RIP metalloprotease RseP [Lachnospiraceae bacterium]|nr:RIP metalloprotease RseP [Lachnospiraceae bacterium]
MSLILSLMVFSLLIFSHELGHFLLAKKNGIGVTEFAIGMGPTLFHFDRGGTTYSLKAVPFGGFCQMVGELEDDSANQREDSFNSKSPWARLSVVLAGPVFNFILAFLLAMFVIGSVGIDRPIISDVIEGLPCEAAGMQGGDRLVQINDQKITVYRDLQLYLMLHEGEPLDITYERGGEETTISIQPVFVKDYNSYMIGIQYENRRSDTTMWETIKYSAYEVKYWMSYTLTSLKMLFKGDVGVDDMSGAVGIVDTLDTIVDETKEYGAYPVLLELANFCILLSANLGVINLLPIPALDGGRLIFILLEIVRGKPIDREKEGLIHTIGMVCLMILMVLLVFNDVRKLF